MNVFRARLRITGIFEDLPVSTYLLNSLLQPRASLMNVDRTSPPPNSEATLSVSMFPANGKQKPHKPHSSQNKTVDKSRLEEYRKAFSFFDANNDGFISSEELCEAMRKCGQNPSRLELKLIMYHGDLDQNGVITFDEFTHLMDGTSNMSKYTYNQLLQQFQMFDKDGDGFIEKHEMYECVKELCLETSFPSEVIEKLFTEADVDGDGKISFDEFVMAVN